MDWTRGRTTSYRFEMVDPVRLDATLGSLDGVSAEESTLEFSYYADLKSSGSLTLVDSNYVENSLVRVFMDVEQGEERRTIELGTFFADPSTMTYEHGRWHGRMPLTGTLLKYRDYLFNMNYAISKGERIAARMARLVSNGLGTAEFMDGLGSSAKTFGKSVVLEFGSSVMEALQTCADMLGAEICDDPHGRTVIRRYDNPKDRPVRMAWPSGEESLTLVGVQREENRADMPNSCIVKMERDGKAYYGQQSLPSSNAASWTRTGRKAYESFTESEDSPNAAKCAASAKRHLSESTQLIRTYKVDSFYVPVSIGDVVDFRYSDTEGDGGISARCMVQTIQMRLSPGTRCTYTLKEVM